MTRDQAEAILDLANIAPRGTVCFFDVESKKWLTANEFPSGYYWRRKLLSDSTGDARRGGWTRMQSFVWLDYRDASIPGQYMLIENPEA